jgi:hypothetical protein
MPPDAYKMLRYDIEGLHWRRYDMFAAIMKLDKVGTFWQRQWPFINSLT